MTTLDPILRTDRLLLRPWRDDDLDAIAAMNADPEVMRYFPSCLDRDGSSAMMARNAQNMRRFGFCWWAIEVPGETSFAGGVNLSIPRFEAHFLPCFEIGWRLPRIHWGKGYASEAAHAVVDFAFHEVMLDDIVAMAVPDNERSRKVMARLGMTHRDIDDFGNPMIAIGHPLRHHVLYRLTRSAWMERGSGPVPKDRKTR